MTTLEKIENLMKLIGTAETSAQPTPDETVKGSTQKDTTKKLPDGYVSPIYSKLLDEIKYYPNGDAPREHNIFWSVLEDVHMWYCSDKPVGVLMKSGKVLQIAPNAYEQLTSSIAKKWAMNRDWIPEYRYTLEDNKSIIWLEIQQAIIDGATTSQVAKRCFTKLDEVYAFGDGDMYKTIQSDEVCNDAERYMYATLFTEDINSLHHLTDMFGDELPLPTEDDLKVYTSDEMEQFERIKQIFRNVKSKHDAASLESWQSALCFALNLPTKVAVNFIYGERANGSKKYHRCEVAYSRQAHQVFDWILEEVETMIKSGTAQGLDKWIKVWEFNKQSAYARQLYSIVKNFNIMHIEEKSPEDVAIRRLITKEPDRAVQLLQAVVDKAEETLGVNFYVGK